MKKIIISIVTLVVITAVIVVSIVLSQKQDSTLKKVKVAEVTHSVFYAPQYAADALGYFEEEGLDVELILTAGDVTKSDKKTA